MHSLTCLLIDDDPDDREIFSIALEEADKTCEYVTATSAAEALALLKSDPSFVPDFIFLDLNMPLVDGKECLRELKEIPHLKKTPIIIYTTSSYEKDVDDTKQLGATHYLAKPFSIATLAESLKSILKRQHLPFFLKS